MEVGPADDTFQVYQGGVQYPVDYAPVWKYFAKDGLKPTGVAEVEELHRSFAVQQSLGERDGLVLFAPDWVNRVP